MDPEWGGDLGGGGLTSLGPSPNLGLKWGNGADSLRKQAASGAALVSKKISSSKILPSVKTLENCGCGCSEAESAMLVQGLQVWPWTGQGLALQWEMFPLPTTRGSVARPPKLTSPP